MRLYEFAGNTPRTNLEQLLVRQLIRLIQTGHRSKQFKLSRLCGNPSARTVISARYPTVQSTAEHMPERILAKLAAQELQPVAQRVAGQTAAPAAKPVAVRNAPKPNVPVSANKTAPAAVNTPVQAQSMSSTDNAKAGAAPADQADNINDQQLTSNDADATETKPAPISAGAVSQAKMRNATDDQLANKLVSPFETQ